MRDRLTLDNVVAALAAIVTIGIAVFLMRLSSIHSFPLGQLAATTIAGALFALIVSVSRRREAGTWAHLARGYLAFTARRTEGAIREYQRALELNPNFATTHGYLGWAWYSMDNPTRRSPSSSALYA